MRVSDQNIDRIYINQLNRAPNYKMVENHFHYYYELYYLRQGQMYISNHPYPLEAGDFVIIPPREVHVNHYRTNCVRINLYFRSKDLLSEDHPFYQAVTDTLFKPGVIHIPSAYRPSIDRLFEGMLQEETINDIGTPSMMTGMFHLFLVSAARYGIRREAEAMVNIETSQEIHMAIQYIREHYNQPITLDSLADLAGLSTTYFSRKFHQVTGMGMKEYLTYVRLSNAEKELLSTRHSVTQVAMDCGFSNPNYFKDAFKKTYGMSPKAYRKSIVTDMITQQSLTQSES